MPVKSLSQSSLTNFQKYSSFLAGNEPPGSYHLLETEVLSGSTGAIVFNSLNTKYSSTYQHLQLRAAVRTDRTPTYKGDGIYIQINGDTGANYSHHRLLGYANSVVAGANTGRNYIDLAASTSSVAPTYEFAPIVADILDPFNSSKNLTVKAFSNGYNGNDTLVALRSGVWMSTAALTSINLFSVTGSNLVSGCRFSLYGLKG